MGLKNINRRQIQIFVLCWVAYACIYLGRLNLSISIPEIGKEFGFNKAQLGIIGSVFFWVYGTGQLINGYIGDKASGRLLIFLGLLVTAISNIFFGFTASLAVMCILWAVNGYFQSMLWGPISKIISNWFPKSKSDSAIIGISTSMVGGYIAIFLAGSKLIDSLGWRWVFWLPGLFILTYSFVWLLKIRNKPVDSSIALNNKDDMIKQPGYTYEEARPSLLKISKITGLWFIASACIAQGIVKDGINLWAPTYFLETFNLDIKSAVSLILIIPLMNFGGMLLAGWLNKIFGNNAAKTTALLFTGGTVMIIGLMVLGSKNIYASTIFLGLSSAMMYGANTMLLGVFPLTFSKYNLVSTAAGFLDFCSYLAAGFASILTGIVANKLGWQYVIIMWFIATSAGVVSLISCQMAMKKQKFSPVNDH